MGSLCVPGRGSFYVWIPGGWRWVTPGGWRASPSFSSCPLNHSPDLLVSTFYLPTALSLSLIFNPFDRERQKAEEHYNWYDRFEEANIKSEKKCVGELKFRYIVRMVNDHWSFTPTTSKQKFRNEQWEISYGFHSTRLVRSEVSALCNVHCTLLCLLEGVHCASRCHCL